jgi:hypothetical protein
MTHVSPVIFYREELDMNQSFFTPDLGTDTDSPFARDAAGKLVRRGYWLDLSDRSVIMAMTQGVGAHLTNDQKRAHLNDIGRASLIDDVCVQEILPPEK